MKKIYLFLVVLTTLFSAQIVVAQENKPTTQKQEPIEGLTIYPNPVSSGKIYIASKNSLAKDIEIFDVLGKRILQQTVSTKEVNISNLTPGVYIIKIKEGEATATRKLIVK